MGAGEVTLGVVGAGTMGAGIAEAAARAGIEVRLQDAVPEGLRRGLDRIERSLRRSVERGRLGAAEAEQVRARVQAVERLDDLAGCNFVIEAVPEDMELKRAVFRALDGVCPPPAVLATNTSSLSVTALAAASAAPERVLGMHFFNPAPVMPLVEVIAGAQTAETALAAAEALARRMGKTPVRAKDTPGFIVNRVARPYYGEALRLVGEGVAGVEDVDAALRGAGFPMGPFELIDLIGVDVNLAVTRSVYEASFHEPRYRPHRLQQQMVDAGRLGRKTGVGFYRYDAEGRMAGSVLPRPHAGGPEDEPVAPAELRRVAVLGSGPLAELLAQRLRAGGVEVTGSPGDADLTLDVRPGTGEPPASATWARSLHDRPLAAVPGRPLFGFALFPPLGEGSLLEWVPGDDTRGPAFAAALGRALGLRPLRVGDAPGGIVARVVCALINEAVFARDEGVAAEDAIDAAMRLGTNYPRGPFAWLREAGPELVLSVLEGLHAWFGEDRYRPAPGLRRTALAARR